jgi:predicted MPP superfamily phosphohydrolase
MRHTSEFIGALVFLTTIMAIYGLELLFLSRLAYCKIRGKPCKVYRCRFSIVVHVLAVIGIGCFLYGRFIEPYWIEVNTFTIQTEKLSESSFRVVQFSDIHCSKEPVNEKKLVELINALDADVVVFTGDALNDRTVLPRFKKTMKNLNAALGKFAVRGNFEINYTSDLDLYSDTGFRVLDRNSTYVEKNEERINIAGITCRYPHQYTEVLRTVPQERFSIFLYHFPGLVEDVKDHNVDLYLCGHTHGGQVALPFYGAIVTLSKFGKKYEAGLYELDHCLLYVNRGVGLENSPAPKVRFFARPEIAVFDIVPKAPSP